MEKNHIIRKGKIKLDAELMDYWIVGLND